MPKYVAFLRAINVGGHVVKMERLQRLFEELGFDEVETFIASGNVIFTSGSKSPQALEKKIAAHLEKALGYAVPAFLRTPDELAAIAGHAPFGDVGFAPKGPGLYVGFVAGSPAAEAKSRFAALKCATDEFHVRGREVYWLCRERMMGSSYSGGQLEKTAGMPITFRSVTTVAKLAARHGAGQGKTEAKKR
jgi:uncharacterized protein (DUF1697 family)